MKISSNTLYHVYNRGNNKEPVFFRERNYSFFKNKAYNELKSELDFLAYCLMPNHFYFLVYTKSGFNHQKFTNGIWTLLSSYTRAIQKQEKITGSLFQQNTMYKELTSNEYALACFHYIHQNPLRARLVNRIEDWPHQSFNEYYSDTPGFCSKELAEELISIPTENQNFYKESYLVIPDGLMNELI